MGRGCRIYFEVWKAMTVSDYRLEPPNPPAYPSCPICGSELYDYIVEDAYGDVVGCSECVKHKTAEEYMEDNDDGW